MKIIITGGRNYKNIEHLEMVLYHIFPDEIVHGDCLTGADALAKNWCISMKKKHIPYTARWNLYGPAAGPIRNKLMIDEQLHSSSFLLAFNGGRGTKNCMDYALKMGMIVLKVEE